VTPPNAGPEAAKLDGSYIACGNIKWHWDWKGLPVPCKTKHLTILHDPAITLLGVYPTEKKTSVHTKTVHKYS
jgi:hypothetical protein